jgi:hypothetical protein
MPFCFYAKDAEAAVVVVESDPLDYTGYFLGRGSALWHGGGHDWGFILPRMDGAGEIQYGGTPKGRIVERMAKLKSKSQPTWTDVKAKLADFDRAALLGLIQSLYAAHKDNQMFLHTRFGLVEDVLEPLQEHH